MSQTSGISTKILSRLREKLPDQQVGLAPADAFFTRRIDLPDKLSWSDKVAYLELALEGNAPFPMDQLAWGFLGSQESPFAFVYATPRSRLKRLEIDPAGSYFQLFPGFISLFGESAPKPSIRFISQTGVLSAVFLEANNPVPHKLISRRIEAELLTDDALLMARQRMLDTMDTEGATPEDGLWLGEGVEILPNERIRFKHRHVAPRTPEGIKEHLLDLPENELWAADLRDTAFADQERAIRSRSRIIWKSLRFAMFAAILLLVFQIGSIGLAGFNVLQEKQLSELEPKATRVENKITLAQRLTQSTEEDLKPFLLMEAINPLRPDTVFFDKVRSRAYNQLELSGQSAEGVTPVNAFADSINQLPSVDSVQNNVQTRNNQTSFEFLITFASMPPEPEGGFIVPEEEDSEVAENDGNG